MGPADGARLLEIAPLASSGDRPVIAAYSAIEYARNLDSLVCYSAVDGPRVYAIAVRSGSTDLLRPALLSLARPAASYSEPGVLTMKNAPLTTKSRASESLGRNLLTTLQAGHRVVQTSFSNLRTACDRVPLQE